MENSKKETLKKRIEKVVRWIECWVLLAVLFLIIGFLVVDKILGFIIKLKVLF